MKWNRIKGLLYKHWCITKGSVERIFDIFYWPLIDILTWGFMSIFLVKENFPNLIKIFVGSTVLWVFVWRLSQDFNIYLLEDFWSRNLYHLFASPVREGEHILALMILSFIRGFASFAFLSLIAFALYSLNIFSVPILYLGVSILNLMLFGWVIGVFINAVIMWLGSRIQVFAWSIVWIVYPFSCLFYPLSSLPPWAYQIGRLLPTTYTFEGLRAILNNTAVPIGGLVYALIMDIILLSLGMLVLKFALRKARESGRLAKPE